MDLRKGEHGGLPLVVGVTGHRDLCADDVAPLTAAVDEIFVKLAAAFASTPLIVLSALAEGADRLVADAGIRHGAKLVVSLPMPLEEFKNDFTTPESCAEFDRLCALAIGVFVVPFEDPKYAPNTPLTGEGRDRRYAAGGAYMAVNSDVLIALWNGLPADRVGGTACIVDYKLQGVPEPYGPRPNPLDAVESGPVYQIVTPRQRDEVRPEDAFTRKNHYPENWGDDDAGAHAFYLDVYRHIDTFNRDSLRPPVTVKPQDSASGNLHAIADALAIRFRTWSRRILLAIFLLVGFSVAAFEIYAHLTHERAWLAADVGGFTIATALFVYTLLARFDTKYQDYRALAEGLRVQRFWQLAGIDDSVAAHYLRKQKSELDWIRDAIRSSRVLSDAEAARNEHRPPLAVRLKTVNDAWVVDQCIWFETNVGAEQHKADRFNELASGTFVGGLIVAFAVVCWLFAAGAEFEAEARERTVTFIALTAVIAGLLHNYAEKRAWSAHAKQYHRMQLIFTNAATKAKRLLAEPTDENMAELCGLYTELGREALIENADWLLLHRERRTDIPVG